MLTPQDANTKNREICGLAPVIPVLTVTEVAHARPLAEALVAGGLPALEVTLRTPAALEAIRAMSDVPGGVVGAGTLITPQDVRNAVDAGAKFGVSPGATPALLAACAEADLPLLAGAATASEVMALMEAGYTVGK
ncbi:MAG: keto-deoxy-phosphogluconate aldolase, partial [Pseudomonadota bacterium]